MGKVRRVFGLARAATALGSSALRHAVVGESAAEVRLGKLAMEELDQLKGLAMKVGQILSTLPGVLPDHTAGELTGLHLGKKAMGPDEVYRLVEQGLGCSVEQAFDSFEQQPVAAASIGQVHRAVFKGAPVAVKVQMPTVAQLLDADFARLKHFGKLASLGTSVDGEALVRELRIRMLEETDYEREAHSQMAFHHGWSAMSTPFEVEIPTVVPEVSSATVLTTSWAEGTVWSSSDELLINQVAPTIVGFFYGSLFGLGAMQADPHPGNLLLREDGVVALDFGCVRRLNEEVVWATRELMWGIVLNDRERFERGLRASGQIGRESGFDLDAEWRYERELFRPFWQSEFRCSKRWFSKIMRQYGMTSKNLRHVAIPGHQLWLLRLHSSLLGSLSRAHVHSDLRQAMITALELPCHALF